MLLSATLLGCGGSGGSGNATGGTTTGGGASCPPQSLSGLVNLTQELSPHLGNTVTASFTAKPFSGIVDFGCNAACRFTPAGTEGSDAGLSYIDIGTVIITDTTSKANEALTETSMVYLAQSFTWAAGDTLQIAGGNETLPTFSVSIQTPPPILVTGPPEIAAGQTVMASQAAGLTISWTPATRAVAFVSVGILSPAGEIDCYPADSAGTVTISPAMLANVPAGTYPTGLTIGRWATTIGTSSGNNIGMLAEAFVGAGIQVGP